jgi:hypothetical protein
MKQTAVQWLINEMHKKQHGLTETSYNHLFDKAKETERQQQDQLSIDFAQWAIDYSFDGAYLHHLEDLLTEFKKEKGL